MLRICERRGWTPSTWGSLTEAEQIDLLAYEYRRGIFLQSYIDSFNRKIDEKEGIDVAAYVMLFLAKYI